MNYVFIYVDKNPWMYNVLMYVHNTYANKLGMSLYAYANLKQVLVFIQKHTHESYIWFKILIILQYIQFFQLKKVKTLEFNGLHPKLRK